MKKVIGFIILLLLLVGCATVETKERLYVSTYKESDTKFNTVTIGMPKEEVKEKWGEPSYIWEETMFEDEGWVYDFDIAGGLRYIIRFIDNKVAKIIEKRKR